MDKSETTRESVKKQAKRKKRYRISTKGKIRLTLAAAVLLLVVILIFRLAMYIGSISRTHLNDDGLKHAARYQNCVVVHGIDVSEYQNEINWKKVKSSEADFVFIRAGYRSGESGELNEDPNFRKNMKKAHKAGLMTGAYFFSQALHSKNLFQTQHNFYSSPRTHHISRLNHKQ